MRFAFKQKTALKYLDAGMIRTEQRVLKVEILLLGEQGRLHDSRSISKGVLDLVVVKKS
jgi:hypothetical protein